MLRNTSPRRGSFLVPVTGVAGLFTLLAVTALFLVNRAGDNSSKPADSNDTVVAGDTQPAELNPPVKRVEAVRQRPTATPAETPPVALAESSPVDVRLKTVREHLTAGEFGPALAVAANVNGLQEKSNLLRTIADAQMNAGETGAALRTLRGIPLKEERRAAAHDQIQQWASAAGGSGADFGPLTDLIQQETSGPWFDEDGVGGTISNLETGVRVDPNGQLSHLTRVELRNRLKSFGIRARNADLNEDMARPTPLRFVSLTRLEKEIRKRLDEGESVVETMKNFAGLYKVEYVL
ncbi:MAG: hypothetical protein ACE5KM_18895, partial [Planctomycetaceae bacterium]